MTERCRAAFLKPQSTPSNLEGLLKMPGSSGLGWGLELVQGRVRTQVSAQSIAAAEMSGESGEDSRAKGLHKREVSV